MFSRVRCGTSVNVLINAYLCQHSRYIQTSCRVSSSLSQLSLKNPNVQKYIKNLVTSEEHLRKNPNLYNVVHQIEDKLQELTELEALVEENNELKEAACKEKDELNQVLGSLEKEFFQVVLEPEPFDHNDIVMEVSGAVGGQEAMLFAQELFRMYNNYCILRGFEFAVTKYDVTDTGGMRSGHATISGNGVYQYFKYEGGVHRVQRIPKTEKGGRVHTSTATVAILPLPTEQQVVINPQDLKFEAKKATGAGGMHVNTTESAVRLTHLPSGMVVDCQMERSQIRNRDLALKMLRARLYAKKVEAQMNAIQSKRKLQVGLAGRSEKIRTYNYVQDRITDHRIGLSLHNLKEILNGYEAFNNLVEKLQEFNDNERIVQLFTQN